MKKDENKTQKMKQHKYKKKSLKKKEKNRKVITSNFAYLSSKKDWLLWFVVSLECFSGRGGREVRRWCPLKFCLTWEFNSEKSLNRLQEDIMEKKKWDLKWKEIKLKV